MKSFARWAGVVGVIGLFAVGIYYRETLYGFYLYQFATWEEDAFIGKPLSELEDRLRQRGRRLDQPDINAFALRTDRPLRDNERVWRFVHGKGYSYFRIGTAHNLGYVLTTNSGSNFTIIGILRYMDVDSF